MVAEHLRISHAAARRLLEEGMVRLGSRRPRKGERVAAGQRITVEGAIPDAAGLRPLPQPELPLVVLHADEALLALDKPAGIPCHPLRAGETGTLANALVARFPECAYAGDDPREGGLVQRLDTGTSGVLLAARDGATWRALRALLSSGRSDKEYLALVDGVVRQPGEVTRALLHAPGDARRVLCVPEDTPEARPARTRYQPIGGDSRHTLLRAFTSTGRMHQVRAHLADAGHPLTGDVLYGGAPELPAFLLHAARLVLPHPRGGTLDLRAPLPAPSLAVLAALGIAADPLPSH